MPKCTHTGFHHSPDGQAQVARPRCPDVWRTD